MIAPHRQVPIRDVIRAGAIVLTLSTLLSAGCGTAERGADAVQRNGAATIDPAADRPSGGGLRPVPATDAAADSPNNDSRTPSSPIRFIDRTAGSGVDTFTPCGGPGPNRWMTEQNGVGVAVADFDRDGVADLFFTNGSDFRRPADGPHTQRLFLGRGDFQFVDATTAGGMTAHGFGQGCAAADCDNDGFVDLFVACYGQDRLWRNNGDGTFTEVTEECGLPKEKQWGTSAAFADLDDDGDLDLFVVNYVDWSPDEPPCFSQHRPPVKISCSPTTRAGQSCFLHRNLGDGRFEPAGESAGVALGAACKGLALAIADLDDDGRPDVYVANDTTPNHLFRNLGGLRFVEEGVKRGAAVSADGIAGASMGVALGDYDRDGRFDLAVTNFLHQPNDLFQNLGEAGFRPANEETGLDAPSKPMLSFGILFADFDLDGWSDLFVANGHIWDLSELKENRLPYRMTQQIFRNESGTRFRDVSRGCGPWFETPRLGRATATGDLDGDGDPDLVVCLHDEPPALLENRSERAAGAARVVFVGTRATRQPLGAKVRWTCAGRTDVAWIPSGGSFQATLEESLMLPCGSSASIERLEIDWGSGRVESWRDIPTDRMTRLIEGTGSTRGDRAR